MKEVILYGAGEKGKEAYNFLKAYDKNNSIYCFCDKNAIEIKEIFGKRVISFEEAKNLNKPFVITVDKNTSAYLEIEESISSAGADCYKNITDYLMSVHNMDRVEIERKYIEYHHEKHMDWYYEDAEKYGIATFWDKDTVFYSMFDKLDLTNVIELACGWGRHVKYYIDKAGSVMLVDILQRNIDVCKERYSKNEKVDFYKNNGYDFEDLKDDTYTAIFSYDAVVHFEMMDIYSYLKEMYRVLVPGGMALIHHSNDGSDYKNTFGNSSNPHGRNFMSKTVFAYMAHRCGFEIVEQQVIDWGGEKDLDCVSLIRKPI